MNRKKNIDLVVEHCDKRLLPLFLAYLKNRKTLQQVFENLSHGNNFSARKHTLLAKKLPVKLTI